MNALLLVFKFVAGIVGHSAAMLADAVHSTSDFVTDVIVLVFVRISSKPKDKSHDYGHGKYETLAMTIIGVALLAVAIGILYNGVMKIASCLKGETLEAPGMLALWAALLSIVLKEAVYRYSMMKARQLQSQAVEANAWHHRSDALSSIGAAIGIGGAIFLGERWTVLDPVASVIVGLFIVKVSIDSWSNPCPTRWKRRSCDWQPPCQMSWSPTTCAPDASVTTMPSSSTSSWTATSPCMRLTTGHRRWRIYSGNTTVTGRTSSCM